jgi:hypothetical protein
MGRKVPASKIIKFGRDHGGKDKVVLERSTKYHFDSDKKEKSNVPHI